MVDPPGWMDPVIHDAAAFHDAIAEVDATIARLVEAMDDRVTRVGRLSSAWHGRAASRFVDDYGHRLLAVHHDVVGELEATRRNLQTAIEAIEAENASRGRLRDQWRLDRQRRG